VDDPKARAVKVNHTLEGADELLATSTRLIAETQKLIERSRELVKAQAELLASLKRSKDVAKSSVLGQKRELKK
jgi:hypothetical protein